MKRVSLIPPEAIPVASATSPSSITIEGIAASAGIVIGPALVIGNPNASYVKRAISEPRIEDEW